MSTLNEEIADLQEARNNLIHVILDATGPLKPFILLIRWFLDHPYILAILLSGFSAFIVTALILNW